MDIGSLGATLEHALLVKIPKAWYQLCAAGTRKSMSGPTSDALSTSSRVENLQAAAITKYDRTHPKGVNAFDLRVYKNWNEEALQLDAVRGEYGKTSATLLIVEVPRKEELYELSPLQIAGSEGRVGNDRESIQTSGTMRFMVLEHSSGTDAGDGDQEIYQAFATRTSAFMKCITKCMQVLKEGSIDEFTTTTTLHAYAFIVAAFRGDENFSSSATRTDVEETLELRKQT
ncbi:hypothetical protein PC117_g15065 [Phytophthora cactorum]|uniref:Uncharacterized protein n=1 Tax=Phytophthora cactorum TaxID=29920 RepID=A0A8T1CQC6_9STRA|nr:hypothetical protein PC117_g15065 [Phytophthora cactorum]